MNHVEQRTRRQVRVTFDNGEDIETEINGTVQEIRDYYVGQSFNIGKNGKDALHNVKRLEFTDGGPGS